MKQKAAALHYEPKSKNAPKVIAHGEGVIAQKIIAKAHEFNIPLFQNELLVNSLVNLDIDETIPHELYNSVVEVFLWLMKNEEKLKKSAAEERGL